MYVYPNNFHFIMLPSSAGVWVMLSFILLFVNKIKTQQSQFEHICCCLFQFKDSIIGKQVINKVNYSMSRMQVAIREITCGTIYDCLIKTCL